MPASLLVVDDTPENIDLVVSMLAGQELDIMAATSGERALDLVARRQPDLVLLDVMMPGMDGFETCRRLRQLPATAAVPVIFVTAKADDVGQGFAAGGSDYIAKPVRADELRARVHHHLERRRLWRELQQMNEQLEQRVRERTQDLVRSNRLLREEINERRFIQDRLTYLATHDFVTRLYNRDALENHVQQALLARAPGAADAGCLLVLELGRFRIVNDSCGFIAGDELLRQVADLLGALCGSDGFLARLGGDRFAVFTRLGAEAALQLGQQLRSSFQGYQFHWEGRSYPIDARVAVLPLTSVYSSFDQLMAKADEACYVVRRQPGEAVRLHRSRLDEADPRAAVNWANRLLDAVQGNQLRVHFQCIVPLQAPAAGLQMEVLVRLWDEAQKRTLPPAAFMAAAERYQLVDQIDRWMLDATMRRLAAWPELLEHVERVSVNLSSQSVRDAHQADAILQLLDETGFPPGKLCLEITESEAVVNIDQAKEFMDRLRAHGVWFSLDDFGTGFASFAYLKRLPFDRIKIDGAFVKDMDSDPANAAMVGSMVQMAQALRLPVVAEYVERASVAEQLRGMGVQYAQGYHFHEPEDMTADSLRAALSGAAGG
jgi:diguanylate cyclase (GGDEF)-like protein